MLLIILQEPENGLALLFTLITISVLTVVIFRLRKQVQLLSVNVQRAQLEKDRKESELRAVDTLIAVQERERVAITRELHDTLGCMLTTLKYNFENIRLRRNLPTEELDKMYNRTDVMIDEAYYNVKRLASDNGSGTLPESTLMPEIKKLTEGKAVNFLVLSHGFDERINNSLEITIFRIIQELVSNIVKHSSATEATIQLTNHGHTVNIIAEDNGIGFNPENTELKEPGLAGLRKKLAALGGTFEIDSTPGKGTTVITELPI